MTDAIKCEAGNDARTFDAPALPYLPPCPRGRAPGIALVGCGGIAPYHLAAYAACGFPVKALCDLDFGRASALAEEYAPDAFVTVSFDSVLDRKDITVLDIATHPEQREKLIDRALRAGKHVLSQKPFMRDLDTAAATAYFAEKRGLRLAVNQNGRWAPHFSYLRHAVAAGVIGRVTGVHCSVHWDHSWTAGTPFDDIPHLILYDFGIHWFDIASCLIGLDRRAESVYAVTCRTATQKAKPPMMASAVIRYADAIATLDFNGDVQIGALDTTRVVGTEGVLESRGPDLNHQSVTLFTKDGSAQPQLEGDWFTNGFQGTMGELLRAIEDGDEPSNSARSVLAGHALCFAATASADRGQPVRPGEVRRI